MPEEEREEQDSKANFIAYPKPLEGPKTPYKHVLGTNPVLTGLPLAIAGSACVGSHIQRSQPES